MRGRMRVRAAVLGTMVALVLVAAGACRVATVRRLDEKGAPEDAPAAAGKAFDAVAFVDSIWRSEVLRSLDEAREAGEVVRGTAGPGATGAAPRSVVVRGRGRVLSVDTRSRSGAASLELDGKPRAVVIVQVGPVISGTAIRDALPALGFDRFVNQIEHADVGNELNARVERDVLGRLDRSSLRGRRLRFAGMATLEDGRPLTVTPVRIEAESQR
jgi:predicted lipoprotein